MRAPARSLLLILVVSLIPAGTAAHTWNISPDGSGDAPMIQAGIDSAAVGDTVLLHDGTYTGTGNKDLDFGGKNLVLRSLNGPEVTIIDCQGSGRGFYFHNGESPASVVMGLTITNGSATSGGGVHMWDSRPLIVGCRIQNNHASGRGGGIYSYRPFNASVRRCVISGNTAGAGGGGVSVEGHHYLTVDSCVVTGNVAIGGGGIFSGMETDLQVNRSTIAGNRADWGGGVLVNSGGSGLAYLFEVVVWGNCANDEGGGDDVFGEASADGICVDSAGWAGGFLTYWVYDDPLFCGPVDCAEAPTVMGDYTLDAASPCLPQNNPLGQWGMGALGQGCDVFTSVAAGPPGGQKDPLFSVSPNPSRGVFTVRYNLPSSTTSSLAVYDIAGRIVRMLGASGASGIALWDGKDGAGRDASPGVYFVRVTARDFTDTRRVILVR